MKYLMKEAAKCGTLWMVICSLVMTLIESLLDANILRFISEATANFGNESGIYYIKLVAGLFVASIILAYLMRWTKSMSVHKFFTHLNKEMSKKYLESDYEMYTKYDPSEIDKMCTDLWKFCKLPSTIISLVGYIVELLVNVGMILYLSLHVGIIVIILYIPGSFLMYREWQLYLKYDSEMDDLKGSRNQELKQVIEGFKEVRSFPGTIPTHRRSLNDKNDKILKIIGKRKNADGMIDVASVGTSGLVTVVTLLILMRGGGTISASLMVSLVMYVWRLDTPINQLMTIGSELSDGMAPLPKFISFMDYENTVSAGSTHLDRFDSGITFENVGFGYEESSYVLEDFNLKIHKGDHIGICGPSGGGKSTLLKLIPKFYDVSTGVIKVDGIDIKELTHESLREHIGIIHQDTYVFNGSIYDNVAYAKAGCHVTREEIIDACKKAAIYDFIMSLPDRFDTQVGPKGLKLSGGQKQRIGLARLFLSNPEIIILDEATSALDNETEKFIQDSLDAFKDKTMIVVAHRLSTIKNSDKIVVINDHKIAEEGTHDELMAQKGLYYRMN